MGYNWENFQPGPRHNKIKRTHSFQIILIYIFNIILHWIFLILFISIWRKIQKILLHNILGLNIILTFMHSLSVSLNIVGIDRSELTFRIITRILFQSLVNPDVNGKISFGLEPLVAVVPGTWEWSVWRVPGHMDNHIFIALGLILATWPITWYILGCIEEMNFSYVWSQSEFVSESLSAVAISARIGLSVWFVIMLFVVSEGWRVCIATITALNRAQEWTRVWVSLLVISNHKCISGCECAVGMIACKRSSPFMHYRTMRLESELSSELSVAAIDIADQWLIQ